MQDPIYTFKGEAARLARGLKSLGLFASHSQVLDLIGQVHGRRDWKELKALTRLPAADAAKAMPVPVEHSLDYIESQLHMRGYEELDLDELVLEHVGGRTASQVNNDGMSAQLENLLVALDNRPADLVKRLEDHLEGLDLSQSGVLARVWGPNTPDVQFDLLPWLLRMATAPMLLKLIESSQSSFLGKCDLGDQAAVWSSLHGRTVDRPAITAMREAVRTAQAHDEDLAGITVSIHTRDLRAFVKSNRRFAEEVRAAILAAIDDYNRV